MTASEFTKIVYFDRETIGNALQRVNGGDYQKVNQTNTAKETSGDLSASMEADIKSQLPLLVRVKFAITGKIQAKYTREWLNKTTVTSTDISQFDEVKDRLDVFNEVELKDIVNSLTSLRFLTAFGKIANHLATDIDLRELSSLLEDMEGYDVFDVGDNRYVRFNQEAYLSNYRRNDLSMSKLDVYCVSVGEFDKHDFDFFARMNNIQTIIDVTNQQRTLADYLAKEVASCDSKSASGEESVENRVHLYDAVCAYVSSDN